MDVVGHVVGGSSGVGMAGPDHECSFEVDKGGVEVALAGGGVAYVHGLLKAHTCGGEGRRGLSLGGLRGLRGLGDRTRSQASCHQYASESCCYQAQTVASAGCGLKFEHDSTLKDSKTLEQPKPFYGTPAWVKSTKLYR